MATPSIIDTNSDVAPGASTIAIAPTTAPSPGDLIIVAVAGGQGTRLVQPDFTGFTGGILSIASGNEELPFVTVALDGSYPTFEWEFSGSSDLAIALMVITNGWFNGVAFSENVDSITHPSPTFIGPDPIIIYVGAGRSDGNSLWIMDDEELFGFSDDSATGTPLLTQQVVAASPAFATGGPPIVSANIASMSSAYGPSYTGVELFANGGLPGVALIAAVGIDSVNPDTGSEVSGGLGWFVGTVGWDKAGWGS